MTRTCAFALIWLPATVSFAHASPSCDLSEVQKLFSQTPRPAVIVAPLLSDCEKSGSTDYRLYMIQGVMAREDHHLDDAIALLKKARDLAPQEISPTLELALTQEWRGELRAARATYEQALAIDPKSLGAMLGLARVERAQFHLEEARQTYREVLKIDPRNADARNGLASVAQMDKQFDRARTGYQQVLTDFPDNAEAKAGLTGIDSSYRYQLDLLTGYVNSDQGSSVGGGADLLASLNATDSLELGFYHNDKELPAPELAQQTLLPSNDFRVGYISRVPQNYDWSISYDYRDHSGLATEHWLQGGVGGYVLDGVQLFAGLRDSFGAPQWDGQLADAGVISSVADGWEVVGTGYFSSYAVQVPGGKWHGHDTDYAFSADLNRQGPGNTFFNIGVGYSPDLDNFDVHGRAVIPVIAGNALLFSIDHVSINNETQATIGWRFFLQ